MKLCFTLTNENRYSLIMKSEIKTGIILSYIYIAISMIAGLLYTPRMIKSLGDSEYGLYGLAKAIIEYLSILGLGLHSALIRYTAKYVATKEKKKEEQLGGMFLVIYTIIGLIVLFSGIYLSLNIEKFNFKLLDSEIRTLRILVIILSCNLAFSFPMGVFGGVITAHEKFTFRNSLSVIRELMMPIVILLFLEFGYRSIAMVTIQTIFNLSILLFESFYVIYNVEYRPRFSKFDSEVIKEIIAYTFFIFVGELTDRISNAMNSTILAKFCGATAVSIFSVGALFFSYYINFSASISSFFFPRIVGMAVKNAPSTEMSDLFIKVGRIQLYIIGLIFCGFVSFGLNFIHLWVGEGYNNSYWIAIICMGPTIIGRSQSLGTQILIAKNKHQFRAIFYIFVVLFDIIISIALVNKYGGIGVAIGTAIAQLLGPGILMNIYYTKVIGLDIMRYWKNVIPFLIFCGIISVSAKMLNSLYSATTWIFLFGQILLFIFVFLISVFILFFNTYERELFNSLFAKFLFTRKKQ